MAPAASEEAKWGMGMKLSGIVFTIEVYMRGRTPEYQTLRVLLQPASTFTDIAEALFANPPSPRFQ